MQLQTQASESEICFFGQQPFFGLFLGEAILVMWALTDEIDPGSPFQRGTEIMGKKYILFSVSGREEAM